MTPEESYRRYFNILNAKSLSFPIVIISMTFSTDASSFIFLILLAYFVL